MFLATRVKTPEKAHLDVVAMPVITTLGRLRQESPCEFKANLNSMETLSQQSKAKQNQKVPKMHIFVWWHEELCAEGFCPPSEGAGSRPD